MRYLLLPMIPSIAILPSCESQSPTAAPVTAPATAAAAADTAPVQRSATVVSFDVTATNRALAEQAFQSLVTTCPLPMDDLAAIQVSIEELAPEHYLAKTYGWRSAVLVEPRFRELDQLGATWQELRAGGHTTDFRLGAGRSPGIAAMKSFSRRLCGMDETSSTTQHRSVPGLSFLKVLDEKAAAATDDVPPPQPGLPPTGLDMGKLLGATRNEVVAYLGKPTGEDQWDRGSYIVVTEFDDENVLSFVSVAFPDLEPHQAKGKEVRRWAGLPPAGKTVRAGRYQYTIELNEFALVLKR